MYPAGHLGISLLLYAPIALFLGLNGFIIFAALGFLMVGAFATLPDKDMNAPILSHRGISHTVASAILFGVVVGFVAIFFVPIFSLIGIPAAPVVGFTFFMGAFVVLTHLLGDSITPSGVKPFAPFSSWKISFDYVRAENRVANLVLWAIGWLVTILVFLLVIGSLV